MADTGGQGQIKGQPTFHGTWWMSARKAYRVAFSTSADHSLWEGISERVCCQLCAALPGAWPGDSPDCEDLERVIGSFCISNPGHALLAISSLVPSVAGFVNL